jgi:hypothetical protein
MYSSLYVLRIPLHARNEYEEDTRETKLLTCTEYYEYYLSFVLVSMFFVFLYAARRNEIAHENYNNMSILFTRKQDCAASESL